MGIVQNGSHRALQNLHQYMCSKNEAMGVLHMNVAWRTVCVWERQGQGCCTWVLYGPWVLHGA